jgi:hypothetical protein
MRRGLIPSWWKKTAKDVASTFNARAEAVAEKPSTITDLCRPDTSAPLKGLAICPIDAHLR